MMSLTPIYLKLNISATVQDRQLFSIDHTEEIMLRIIWSRDHDVTYRKWWQFKAGVCCEPTTAVKF